MEILKAKKQAAVAIAGSSSGHSAYARVNAAWLRGFETRGLTTIGEDAALPEVAATLEKGTRLIHHDFLHPFEAYRPTVPAAVAARTWDFGPLPPSWASIIRTHYAQYWAYSGWIAQQARAAGIEDEKIHVVPPGYDPDLFHPDGPALSGLSDRKFHFLFVGGSCARKGTDILLKGYREAFSAADDVALVLKDHSADAFYRDEPARESIGLNAKDAPKVVHIDRFLDDEELASLYRAADVAVFPYRAEGFCMPLVEAMACGLPTIAPRFGACLDYADDSSTHFLDARRIRLPVHRKMKLALGFDTEVDEVDFCEVAPATVAAALRRLFDASREERRRMGLAGQKRAGQFTWQHSVDLALQALDEMPAPVFS